MRAPNHFIVSVPKTRKDKISLGDSEIYLDSKFEPFEHRIAYGEIVAAPENFDTGAKAGDTLFFHHHVTTNKSLQIDEETYISMYAPEAGQNVEHSIAYRSKDDGELHMLADWVFVLPVFEEVEDTVTSSGIIAEIGKQKNKYRHMVAEVYVSHPELEREGVKVGDIVGFTKNSDYKIELDNGDIVFRMKIGDLTYVELHDSQGD